MKIFLKLLSFAGLALSIVPSILFFMDSMDMGSMKLWMGLGMIMWMVSAPFWVNKNSGN